jgi:Amiloride-sensitive sodium channel
MIQIRFIKMYKLQLISIGILVIPADVGTSFILNSFKEGETFFIGNLDTSYFPTIELVADNSSAYFCLSAEYDPNSQKLPVIPADCSEPKGVICRTFQIKQPTCNGTQTFKKQNTFDLLLDPLKQADRAKAVTQKKTMYKEMMSRLDQIKSFKALFSTLWYATLPCYDIKNITAKENGERAVLKYCEWKGIPISCAAIFSPYPTDHGMCCSFNMKAATEIFRDGPYPEIITELQTVDDEQAFIDSSVPIWYSSKSEPTTLPGRNKGLLLLLDAHMDQFATASVNTDYDGFMGLINPSGSFPMMAIEGFEIRPGHLNAINLVGSRVDAEDDMRGMSVESRQCKFSDESSDLLIHANYTYSNCIFECSLLYAKNQMALLSNDSKGCIPWYFPTPANLNVYVCDPWESVKFFEFLNLVPDDECSNCLPDCSTTIYEPDLFAIPFRRCDSSNLGVSRFCNLNNKALSQPAKFGTQIKAEYDARHLDPSFIQSFESSIRYYSKTMADGDVFTQNPKTYDAYERDIALVQVYFDKSTVFRMGRQPRMTWIDYFSTVGGLLGLVLGMGIISFIELIWVCLRILAFKLHFTDWVP